MPHFVRAAHLAVVPPVWYTGVGVKRMLWVKRAISVGLSVLLLAQVAQVFLPGKNAYLLSAVAVTVLTLVWYTVAAPLGVTVMRARPVTNPVLQADIDRYACLMGLPRAPQLYVTEQPVANAYALGRPGRSAVVVTTRLLDTLHPLQLAAVLGHELHHIRARDTLFSVFSAVVQLLLRVASWVGAVVAVLIAILLALLNIVAVMCGVFTPASGMSVLGLVCGAGAAVQRVAAWLAAFMNREAELRADLAGARLAAAVTGEAEAMGAAYMASAIQAIERLNGGSRAAGAAGAWASSHPPLERRLRNLARLHR